MVQLPPNIPESSTNLFYIENSVIESVTSFKYLGSTLSLDVSLTSEINNRIAKAASLFSHLKTKDWHNSNLTIKTKLTVYNAVILPALLYGAEAWSANAHQINRLNTLSTWLVYAKP